MDKLTKYRNLIKKVLNEYAELSNRQPVNGLETELLFDEERDNYMLFKVGWWPQGRVRGPTLYIRLRNEKIWVEVDWTEDGIATNLLEFGVPKEDIVLAFHPPNMRQHTEFAIA